MCKNYKNKKILIANKEYPVQQTIQALVDDHLHALVVKVCDGNTIKKCEYCVFSTSPLPPAGTNRPLLVTALPAAVTDSMAFSSDEIDESGCVDGMGASPDEIEDTDTGLPPVIPIPPAAIQFTIQFVASDDNASVIVGFQVLIESDIVVANRFYEPLKLGKFGVKDLEVECQQISGHLANDNKQINILTGQGSCSVSFTMPRCL